MKNYQIVWGQGTNQSEAIERLEEYVQEKLKSGWEPQGGVSIATEVIGYTGRYTACQAMTKNE